MNRGLHRFALLVAGATFFLIIAGALVTSHDAGLATSDWPLTEGAFLPKIESLGISTGVNMVGNLFWEHGHRMVATTVGSADDRPGDFSFRQGKETAGCGGWVWWRWSE